MLNEKSFMAFYQSSIYMHILSNLKIIICNFYENKLTRNFFIQIVSVYYFYLRLFCLITYNFWKISIISMYTLWILPLHYVFVMIGFRKNFLIFCVLLQLHTIIDCNSTTSAKKKERNTIESHKLILIYVGSINIHIKLQSKV